MGSRNIKRLSELRLWPAFCLPQSMSAAMETTPRSDARTDRQPDICKKLARKVAVITGGSTGMGLATAKRFVQEGADHVFITKGRAGRCGR